MERLSETDGDTPSDTHNPIKTGANENAKDWIGIGLGVNLQCLEIGAEKQ